jgi:hypothetical protein
MKKSTLSFFWGEGGGVLCLEGSSKCWSHHDRAENLWKKRIKNKKKDFLKFLFYLCVLKVNTKFSLSSSTFSHVSDGNGSQFQSEK